MWPKSAKRPWGCAKIKNTFKILLACVEYFFLSDFCLLSCVNPSHAYQKGLLFVLHTICRCPVTLTSHGTFSCVWGYLYLWFTFVSVYKQKYYQQFSPFLNYVMLNKKGFSPFQNCKIELSLLNWADLFFRVIVLQRRNLILQWLVSRGNCDLK